MVQKRISVTGYQSFGPYDLNPAEVVVNNLKKYQFSSDLDVEFAAIPVSYEAADFCSRDLCGKGKSDFVVHVGVHPKKETICLEKQARASGYCSMDVDGEIPLNNRPLVCCCTTPEVVRSNLDTEEVIGSLKNVPEGLTVKTSHDPGRYLCSYIFYSSLVNNHGNALFIHIPDFSETATVEVVSDIVAQVIEFIGKTL
ncbi:unnamed protein product [Bursaphelenchus xylophilus]|uniref:(pine wood nematode) hypothetical protein n=1 Tax=Bursaphelenchus xylophilus TaxID=6326 RepID=A0A1I7RVN2_BURXY|nr:unnamed protein product [Bursaphelenchus xylophilus]CAG9081913.1 unnamed protein product [Bursaphelenchus xylophilus]